MRELSGSAKLRMEDLDRDPNSPGQVLFKSIKGLMTGIYREEWKNEKWDVVAEWSAIQDADMISTYWENLIPDEKRQKLELNPDDENYHYKLRDVVAKTAKAMKVAIIKSKQGTDVYPNLDQAGMESDLMIMANALLLIDKYYSHTYKII
jgi:hypothetical protein